MRKSNCILFAIIASLLFGLAVSFPAINRHFSTTSVLVADGGDGGGP